MKLSILMSVYNESGFIEECLDSIFECDDLDYEVVVVDDFSTDDTYSKLEKYRQAKSGGNFLVFRNDVKGKNHALNMAYSRSNGDFFCFVGGDDKILSHKLRGRVDLIRSSLGPAVSLCKLKTFSEKKSLDGLLYPRKKNAGALVGGAMLFNSDFARIVFPLPESLPNEDTWIKLAIQFFDVDIKHYPFVSYLYRQHENNSVKLGSVFLDFSKTISRRNAALNIFKDKFSSDLDEGSIDKLSSSIKLEEFRVRGKVVSMILLGGVSFRSKVSAILLCNPLLYRLRLFFYRLFAGL